MPNSRVFYFLRKYLRRDFQGQGGGGGGSDLLFQNAGITAECYIYNHFYGKKGEDNCLLTNALTMPVIPTYSFSKSNVQYHHSLTSLYMQVISVPNKLSNKIFKITMIYSITRYSRFSNPTGSTPSIYA